MKRFSILFVVAVWGLMLTSMPLHAKVVECATIEAINAAIIQANNINTPDTILLTQDINNAAAIIASGNYNFMLDLGGHTIVGNNEMIDALGGSSNYALIYIASAKARIVNGSLRGKRNGYNSISALIYATSGAEVLVQNVSMYEKVGACVRSNDYSEVTVHNCGLRHEGVGKTSDNKSYSSGCFLVSYTGTINVDHCTAVSEKAYVFYIFTTGGYINIYGGSYTAESTTVNVDDNVNHNWGAQTAMLRMDAKPNVQGSINIDGGTFNGSIFRQDRTETNLNIYSGTFMNVGPGTAIVEEDGQVKIKDVNHATATKPQSLSDYNLVKKHSDSDPYPDINYDPETGSAVVNPEKANPADDKPYPDVPSGGCTAVYTTVQDSIEEGETYMFADLRIFTIGTYSHTFTKADGCDSIVTLILKRSSVTSHHVYDTICPGDSYRFYDRWLTEAGNYKHTLKDIHDQDSLITLHLYVRKPILAPADNQTLCPTEFGSFTWRGKHFASEGTYYDTIRYAVSGCDSIYYTLHLNAFASYHKRDTIVACQQVEWNGRLYTQSGIYSDTVPNSVGCDSIRTLYLTINRLVSVPVEYDTICVSQSPYLWHGQNLNQSGIYYDTVSYRLSDCDSAHYELHLTINPTLKSDTTVYVCEQNLPFEWVVNGVTTWTTDKTGAFLHVDTIPSLTTGCDSIITLHYNGLKTQRVTVPVTAFKQYKWNDKVYSVSGVYSDTTAGADGCDSITILNLTIQNPTYARVENVSICPNDTDTYTWRGKHFNTTGTYRDTLHYLTTGFDSIYYTLQLTLLPILTHHDTLTICRGDMPYVWKDTVFNTVGTHTYAKTYTSQVTGCDSIVTLHLTVLDRYPMPVEYDTICQSELKTYTWHGQQPQASGVYYDTTHYALTGCDSAYYELHLTVHPTLYHHFDMTVCEQELPIAILGDTVISTVGVYDHSRRYQSVLTGCDSIVTAHVTVQAAIDAPVEYDTICVSEMSTYTWRGHKPQTAGEYRDTAYYTSGCDSVHYLLHLTINPVLTTDSVYQMCEQDLPYVWLDTTYNTAGSFTRSTVLTSLVTGCDSIVTLHLTVHPTEHAVSTVTMCREMTWNGRSLTQSGTYVDTLRNRFGCDSIVTLHLTVLKPTVAENKYDTICSADLSQYTWRNRSFTQSGTYADTLYFTATGCDSAYHILHLTVGQPFMAYDTIASCDSYTWRGKTYTASGDYSDAYTTFAGCDSIYHLHLNIHPSYALYDTITSCSAVNYRQQTYDHSGDYVVPLVSVHGCDSVYHLHLTINGGVLYDNLPLVSLYGNRLLLLDRNSIEAQGHSFQAKDVQWFRVEGTQDNPLLPDEEDDELLVSGVEYYSYYNDEVIPAGSYYARIDQPSQGPCGAYIRTRVIKLYTSQQSTPKLAPNRVTKGEPLHIIDLDASAVYTCTVYSSTGETLVTRTFTGLEAQSIDVSLMQGIYLMKLTNDEQSLTLPVTVL